MTDYVVGADGGNSKTDLALARSDGSVLSRMTGPGTRPFRDGVPVTVAALAELGRAAVSAAGLPGDTPLAVGSFYLANVDFPDEEQAMFAALSASRVAERVEVRNDTFAVLKAGSRRGWGIGVVVGAGINAAGMYPDGGTERFLGIGGISGDWGGALAVAETAIGAAVRANDGRGPATALREVIAETFGADPETVAIAANRGEIGDGRLLSFVPGVFRAAADGDLVAIGIAERLADEVVSFVGALLRRMELLADEVDVVLGGGVLQAGHRVLLDRVVARTAALNDRACVRVLDVAPVAGALTSALTLAGADAAAVDRARSALRIG